MNYTKGEWKILHVPEAHQPFLIGIGLDDNHPVATVTKTHFPDEAKANAQLLASAPDMYEALKEILSIIHYNEPLAKANTIIYKAIAKAEGK